MSEPDPTPVIVIALGGHALLPPDDPGTHRNQIRQAARLARSIVAAVRDGNRVLVVHGNGPQVGRELLRVEESATKLPPRPLDVCVANTQGSIGYRLSIALRNALRAADLHIPVSAVLTHVLVSPDDPAFERPSKPIGPWYGAWRAQELKRERGWRMVEEIGRGWRQVVPSPRPVDILDVESATVLLEAGHLVLAGGGGGVPVIIDKKGQISGVEAVIDKDRTAALLAAHIGADAIVFLTEVANVYTDFGRPTQKAIGAISARELREISRDSVFSEGSIGPKVEAALEFVEDGGPRAIITTGDKLLAALNDRAGTRVSAGGPDRDDHSQMLMFAPPEDEAATLEPAAEDAAELPKDDSP